MPRSIRPSARRRAARARRASPPARGIVACLIGGACLVCGCQAPPKNPYAGVGIHESGAVPPPPPTIDPTTVPTRDDIVQVVAIWRQMPFVTEARRYVGFAARVYFIDSQTSKGSFVEGPIAAELHLMQRDESGRLALALLHEWKLDKQQAMGFRIRRESIMGYSYGLVFRWPAELDLAGHQIEVVFRYERTDGRVIRSTPKRLRVPLPQGLAPASRPVE